MSEQRYPLNTNEVEWTDPTVDYYPAGVKEKILWENPDTGAIIALIKYPAGSTTIAHTHTEANEAVYGLTGEVEDQEGNRVSYTGIFGVAPKGVEHSRGGKFTQDTVLLISWDGPR